MCWLVNIQLSEMKWGKGKICWQWGLLADSYQLMIRWDSWSHKKVRMRMREGDGGKDSQPEAAAADEKDNKVAAAKRMRTSYVTCLVDDDIKLGNDWTTNNKRW